MFLRSDDDQAEMMLENGFSNMGAKRIEWLFLEVFFFFFCGLLFVFLAFQRISN